MVLLTIVLFTWQPFVHLPSPLTIEQQEIMYNIGIMYNIVLRFESNHSKMGRGTKYVTRLRLGNSVEYITEPPHFWCITQDWKAL